jgi:hypothetical protein
VLAEFIMSSVKEGVEGPMVSRAPTRPSVGSAPIAKKTEVRAKAPVKKVEKAPVKKAAGKKKQPAIGKKAFEAKSKASPVKDSLISSFQKDGPKKIKKESEISSASSSPKEVTTANIATTKPSKESILATNKLEKMFDDVPIVIESDDELSATEMAVSYPSYTRTEKLQSHAQNA